MLRHVDQIEVAARFRKSLGDIEGLADSMDRLGLLQPLVITPENRLVAGQRRLEAARRLGWQEVPVVVADTLDDAVKLIQAERDENTQREPFTPEEAWAVAQALLKLERPAAKARQGTRTDLQHVEKFSEGRALDKAASAVGMGRHTLVKAGEVVQAAEVEPDRFGPIREEMNRTGKVNGAHKKLEGMLRAAMPGVLEAVDAGDIEGAKELARQYHEEASESTPKREPNPAGVARMEELRKTQEIRIHLFFLSQAPLTGAEFKRVADPQTVKVVRGLVPAVRMLLDEIEVEP